jgi:hypothetical protein
LSALTELATTFDFATGELIVPPQPNTDPVHEAPPQKSAWYSFLFHDFSNYAQESGWYCRGNNNSFGPYTTRKLVHPTKAYLAV